MATRQTSRVFAAWRATTADLRAASWPAHPRSAQIRPEVTFGIAKGFAGEAIVVPGRKPVGGTTQTRATLGAGSGKDETFTLLIGVTTNVPGMESEEVLDRLEELCDVVQQTFRSPQTGLPIGSNVAALTAPAIVRWDITDVTPGIYPTPNGFAGDATLELSFFFRI